MKHLIYEIFFEEAGIILIVLFSIIYPLFKNWHYISSESKKILYKNPLWTFLILLIYGIIMEIFLYIDLDLLGNGEGFDMLAVIIWPINIAKIILATTTFMFLLNLVIFYWNKKRK